jgi:soluble lytic murein transglycosylase-like protein
MLKQDQHREFSKVLMNALPSWPALRDAAQLFTVVVVLGLGVAFGPKMTTQLAATSAQRECAAQLQPGACQDASAAPANPAPAGVAHRATGEQLLAKWGSTPALTSLSAQRNLARFISNRYRIGRDEVSQMVGFAVKTGHETGVDPLLLIAVISVESSFDPQARSAQGAQGLMQVHTKVHIDKFEPFGGAEAAFEPLPNIRVGAGILKEYLRREGTVEGALKSYVGAANLSSDGGYGAKVLKERERLAAAARRATA